MMHMDTHKAVDEIHAAVEYLRKHGRGNGKVGIVGFCMGGALTFASACQLGDEISAAVPFYGVPPPEKVDYDKVTAPILAHFAKRDEWAAPSHAEKIKKKLDARSHPMELHVYEADHAFVNDTRPDVYNSTAAKLAWERTVEFFKKHLG
jgi:carboxymethylenebutenolidase